MPLHLLRGTGIPRDWERGWIRAARQRSYGAFRRQIEAVAARNALKAEVSIAARIALYAIGVGPPIQMCTVTPTGVTRLEPVDLDQVEADVGGWEEVERDTLDQFLGATESEGPAMPPELPPKS